jgi:tetratricopeptide (TPR) repeat protein
MNPYSVARLDDVEEVSDGRIPCRPVRHHFGITSFGANAWIAEKAGDRVINEHDEADDMEELYFVHRGRARFELDSETIDAPAGTLLYAAPGVRRTAFAEEPGTTILVLGGTPGEAYEPDGWELLTPIVPLFVDEKYAEAADRLRDLVDANPGFPMLVYALAYCETRAGRTEAALEHFRAAFVSDRMRRIARKDPDLAALRELPAFRELLYPESSATEG